MEGYRSSLDEALSSIEKSLLIEECVVKSIGFLLHHLIKRFLLSERPVILVAFANPFSHYDCILRKLVRFVVDSSRIMFIDMLNTQLQVRNSGGMDGSGDGDVPVILYERIRSAVGAVSADKTLVTTLVDNISLMEIAWQGSAEGVMDFLHHC